jgi:uncharacterized protein (TIGR00297 family)
VSGDPILGLAVNLAFAATAYLLRTVSVSGLVAGVALGTLVWTTLGPAGWSVLVGFFALGSAVTRCGFARKAQRGLAEAGGGRRGAARALAKVGFPAVLSAAHALVPWSPLPVAFAAALATALADTTGTEIGQLYGRRPVLLPTFRRVEVGTEGAVSLEGTAAGVAASLALALLAWAVSLSPESGPHMLWIVPAAAFVGTTVESLLGSTLEAKGVLGHEATNLLNTVVGALCAGLLVLLLR